MPGPLTRSISGAINVIEVQHLTKRFGRVTAVDDVSFRVERGEIFGFLGPNGAGKTTTMRVLTGYMPATAGRTLVAEDVDLIEKDIVGALRSALAIQRREGKIDIGT